jgi:hypothetical protein
MSNNQNASVNARVNAPVNASVNASVTASGNASVNAPVTASGNAPSGRKSKFATQILVNETKLSVQNQEKIDRSTVNIEDFQKQYDSLKDVTSIQNDVNKLIQVLQSYSSSVPNIQNKNMENTNSNTYISTKYQTALNQKDSYSNYSDQLNGVMIVVNTLLTNISTETQNVQNNMDSITNNLGSNYKDYSTTEFEEQINSLRSLQTKCKNLIIKYKSIKKTLDANFEPLMKQIKAELIDSVVEYYSKKLNLNKASFTTLYSTISNNNNDTTKLVKLKGLKEIVIKIQKYIESTKKITNNNYVTDKNKNQYKLNNTVLVSLGEDYFKMKKTFDELKTELDESITNYETVTKGHINDLTQQVATKIAELKEIVVKSKALLGTNFNANIGKLNKAIEDCFEGQKINSNLNATFTTKLSEIKNKINNTLSTSNLNVKGNIPKPANGNNKPENSVGNKPENSSGNATNVRSLNNGEKITWKSGTGKSMNAKYNNSRPYNSEKRMIPIKNAENNNGTQMPSTTMIKLPSNEANRKSRNLRNSSGRSIIETNL